MKKITLLIDEESKTFTTPFVSGMVLRKYMEAKAKAENLQSLTVDELDVFAALVVHAYKEQFTLEQFYEGIPHDEVMTTVDLLFLPTSKNADEEGNGKK